MSATCRLNSLTGSLVSYRASKSAATCCACAATLVLATLRAAAHNAHVFESANRIPRFLRSRARAETSVPTPPWQVQTTAGRPRLPLPTVTALKNLLVLGLAVACGAGAGISWAPCQKSRATNLAALLAAEGQEGSQEGE